MCRRVEEPNSETLSSVTNNTLPTYTVSPARFGGSPAECLRSAPFSASDALSRAPCLLMSTYSCLDYGMSPVSGPSRAANRSFATGSTQ